MNYTHIFVGAEIDAEGVIGTLHPIGTPAEVVELLKTTVVRAHGFKLVDRNRCTPIVKTNGTEQWRSLGLRGWSYGHVQYGWLCAGAGGLNSMQVMKLETEEVL